MTETAYVTAFAEWLDRELELRGWTHAQLAAHMGKPQQTISSYFVEGRIPRPPMCRAIAQALRIPEDVVLRAAAGLAGHEQMAEESATYGVPEWARLIPLLTDGDQSSLEHLVKSLYSARTASR